MLGPSGLAVQGELRPSLPRAGVTLATADVVILAITALPLQRRFGHQHRRLGAAHRASPAEYLITLEGVSGLGARIGPMGSAIACAAQHIWRRRSAEDIGQMLGRPSGHQATMIRRAWTADGKPAAFSPPIYPANQARAPRPLPLTA
jgi:hypothetical protein